jgi:transposase-like protein
MTLMTVNNHNEQGKDHRSRPRWSAGKKTDAVLRLLRGESLEELSRELQVEAHRLAPGAMTSWPPASRASRASGPTGHLRTGR